MPIEKPAAAGTNASFPAGSHISMAGIRSDHTEAATIMPEAKPSSSFWITGLISFFTKNTLPAPIVVPRNGIRIPKII